MRSGDFAALLRNTDLITLGMKADSMRQQLHPDGIVTYCLEDDSCERLVYTGETMSDEALRIASETRALTPVCAPGITGAEYLKFLAACRVCMSVAHIQVDAAWAGLKVAQLALRFGADDLGFVNARGAKEKPGTGPAEEEVRRLIREAGFVPKERDIQYAWLSLG